MVNKEYVWFPLQFEIYLFIMWIFCEWWSEDFPADQFFCYLYIIWEGNRSLHKPIVPRFDDECPVVLLFYVLLLFYFLIPLLILLVIIYH